MADDDDDSFGEFTFASNSSSHIPATTTTTTSDDDDWGDFNSFQTNTTTTTDHNLKSPPPPPPDTEPKWEKTKGALPLSLFGDDDDVEENHEEKTATPVSGNDNVKQSSFSGNSDKGNSKLGIHDLIANLYGPSQQQQQDQISKAVDNGNELNPVSNKSESLSSSSLNAVTGGNHGSDDEGGWEFINAFSDSKLARNEKDNKERFENSVSPVRAQGDSNRSIDLFAVSNNGAFVESHVRDNGFDSKPFASFQNGFTGDSKDDFKGNINESSLSPVGEAESDGFDDTFGEFETAIMEKPTTQKELSVERFDPLGAHDSNLFAFPNSVPNGSHRENNGFDFSQISVVQNGVTLDPFSQTEWKETKDDSDSLPRDSGANNQKIGKFETTFAASELKVEGSEASSKNYKEPVPLSIFGIEEDSQADTSLNLEHKLFKSSTHKNNLPSQNSNLSINDILSDLYSHAQPISSDRKEDLPHSTGNESIRVVDDNNDDDDDDNFDDDSWEFKDASIQSGVENHNISNGSWELKDVSIQSRVENSNMSFEKKLKICMDFYSNLKDDLAVVARSHLHGLKKAESTATLAGEEMKVIALDKEIQEALVELHKKNIVLTETDLDDHSEQVISLKRYSETLREPDFQLLESEYHISRRLSLAESDLRTTIDLINHSTTVLKFLALAPKGEPADYVSIWFKMISVCSQELKHGTWIWKQSLEKNIHRELLSEQQGKLFILALGEIYRAVVILGAAVKFYKPWILLSGAGLEGINALLDECHTLWSTSELEEAIPAESFSDDIRHIRNLDEFAISKEEESQCGLSLLTPGMVPDMKMVIWNGDKYIVSLANLWANLISPNPPNSTLHVG